MMYRGGIKRSSWAGFALVCTLSLSCGDEHAALPRSDASAPEGAAGVRSVQAFTAALTSSTCAGAAGLQPGSPWPMRSVCPLHQGVSPYIGAQTATVAWSTNLSGAVHTAPAIAADGTIYAGNNNLLFPAFYAVNPNGTIKWSRGGLLGGVESSPAIGADGTVYVGNNAGQLLALNPTNGSVKWTYSGLLAMGGSPTMGPDGTIYIGSNGLLFTALNPNGSVKWTYLHGPIYSSAAIATDGTIYVGGDDWHLYALNSNGTTKWSKNLGGVVRSSPAVATDGTIYVGADTGKLYALNPSDGSIRWSVTTGGIVRSSPVIAADGTVYVGSDDKKVYAINPSGTTKWTRLTGGVVETTPAIGKDGLVYVGSDDKKLYALKPADGTIQFSVLSGGIVRGSPAIGANGTVYFGADDSKLYAVGPGPCTPTSTTDTTCDGIDDNCNGTKDEGYLSVATNCGVGACARTGSTSCVAGVVQNSCAPGTPASSDTSCNGVDDNCNGTTDEGYVSVATSCGVGACGRTGATSCVSGAVHNSCAAGSPAPSDTTCNGIDDNCNGQVDEGYVSTASACGLGACARAGATSCVAGVVQSNCAAGTPAPSDATCNGIDDNCNGLVDEGYLSTTTHCGIGACSRAGSASCALGVVSDSCAPGTPAPSDATCNGVDDNCNGAVDEGYASTVTTCGVGACASTGSTSCVAGLVRNSCAPGTPAAYDTTCNGIDDNCNGVVDERYVPVPTACGTGPCTASGATSCLNGLVSDSCSPGTPAPADATCNGVDDNCNGVVDEGCVVAPVTSGSLKTASIAPTADATIRLIAPFGNDGHSANLSVSSLSVIGLERSLVKFDTAAVANSLGSSRLVSATLRMPVTSTALGWNGGSVAVSRMIQPWTEGGATWTCANDTDTSLLGNNCGPADLWGMDPFSPRPRPYAATVTDQEPVFTGQTAAVSFDVTPDVQGFLAGQLNQGWMVAGKQDLLTGDFARFSSREGTAPPTLVLLYDDGSVASGSGGARVTVSVPVTQDTFVSNDVPDAAHSRDPRLKASSDLPLFTAETLVKFTDADIATRMNALGVTSSAGYQLTAARLRLTTRDAWSASTAGSAVEVHRMLKPWTDKGATWRCANDSTPGNFVLDCAGADNWDMLASDPAQRPYDPTPTDGALAPNVSGTQMVFDVTDDIARILAQTRPNYGWLVQKPDQSWLGFLTFYSIEGGYAPTLELQFDHRTCTAATPCGEGQSGCTTDVTCSRGLICAHGVGARYGAAATANVCIDPACNNPSSSSYDCGATDRKCGLCPTSCTAGCNGRSCGTDACGNSCGAQCNAGQAGCRTDMDCAPGLQCGVGNGPRFGFPQGVRVCWPAVCDSLNQSAIPCGTTNDPCGTCPVCQPSCDGRSCGDDGCGGSCGTCPSGRTCVAETGACYSQLLLSPTPRFAPSPNLPIQTAAVGTLPGMFQVSHAGDATYSIPLEMPPAPGGIQPDLKLHYNSSQGNGYLGVGWSMEGFSSITRCNKTIASDSVAGPVNFDFTDALCLDGQRLVPLRSTVKSSTVVTVEYRTETDRFARILADFPVDLEAETVGSPDSFTVWAKDGRIFEYGTTADSKVAGPAQVGLDDVISASAGAHVWLLKTVKDHVGNLMTYNYKQRSRTTSSGYVREYYPTSITYGNPNLPILVAFTYDAETPGASQRPDPVRAWRNGSRLETNWLLQSVTVFSDPLLSFIPDRVYRFDYEGPQTGVGVHSRLAHAKECTAAGVCKPQTTFAYEPAISGLASGTTLMTPNGETGGLDEVLDLNGDGIDDILTTMDHEHSVFLSHEYTSNWYALLSHRDAAGVTYTGVNTGIRISDHKSDPGSGNRNPITGGPFGLVLDWDNNGTDDVLEINHHEDGQADTYRAMSFDGTGFVRRDTGIPLRGYGKEFAIDVNGDHYKDLLVCDSVDATRATWRLYVNRGVSGVASPTGGGLVEADRVMVATDAPCNDSDAVLDVDGDDREELAFGGHTDAQGNEVPVTILWILPDGRVSYAKTVALAGSLADVNGDGLQDIVHFVSTPNGSDVVVQTSRGDGSFSPEKIHIPAGWAPVMLPWDYDSDGRQDLLVQNISPLYQGNRTWYVHRSIGTTFDNPGEPLANLTAEEALHVGDTNGDGVPDLVGQDFAQNAGEFINTWQRVGPPQERLTAVTDGLGASTSWGYGPLSDTAIHTPSPTTPCSSPFLCRLPRTSVVARHFEYDAPVLTANDLFSAARRFEYTYVGARIDAMGRGPLGFEHRAVAEFGGSSGSWVRDQAYDYDNITREGTHKTYPMAFKPWRVRSTAADGPVLWSTQTTNHFDVTWPTSVSVTALVGTSETVRSTYDIGTFSTITLSDQIYEVISRDKYGNVLSSSKKLDSNETVLTTTDYKHLDDPAFLDDWLISLPTLEETSDFVTSAGQFGVRTNTFDYYSTGLLRTSVVEPYDAHLNLTTTYQYNALGNPRQIKAVDSGNQARTTNVAYDILGEYPETVTNSLSQDSQVQFDRFLGKMTALQDPNGLVSQTGYDKFGRVAFQTRPDGTQTLVTLTPGVGIAQPMISSVADSSGALETSYFDVRGRVTKKAWPGLNGKVMVQVTGYDFDGNVASVSMPTDTSTAPVAGKTITYDGLHRVRTQTTNDGNTSITCYDNNVTCMQDPSTHTSCTVRDDIGRVTKAVDPVFGDCLTIASSALSRAGTAYAYGPFGALIGVSGAATNTTMVNDVFGRKTHVQDGDAGSQDWTYSAFGEVDTYTNGNRQFSAFTHDGLGRLTGRIDHDANGPGSSAVTTWTWDGGASRDPGELIGTLTETTSPDGVKRQWQYNGVGQLVGISTQIGAEKFDTAVSYDAQGRTDTVTYPSSGAAAFRVQNVYDTAGRLAAVRDPDGAPGVLPYWTAIATTAYDQLGMEALGNGTLTLREYDGLGRQKGIQTLSGTAAILQDMAYEYDANGNIRRRSSLVPGVAQAEDLSYDEADRLQYEATAGKYYSYNAANNLFENGQNEYTDPAHAHAITFDGTYNYQYDQAGNRVLRTGGAADQHIAYSWFNKPVKEWESVGNGPQQNMVSFAYDAQQNRVVKTAPNGISAGNLKTVYVDGIYERRMSSLGTEHVYYVTNGARVIAQVSMTNGSQPIVSYLHDDHLGSTQLVTDGSGALKAEQSFDPFGRRRDPHNWSRTTAGVGATTVGFTGQEDDTEFGFVNMRGRIYDPRTRHFLSPDPVVQAPLFGPGLNRYSYVFNNPLRYLDPSGFDGEAADATVTEYAGYEVTEGVSDTGVPYCNWSTPAGDAQAGGPTSGEPAPAEGPTGGAGENTPTPDVLSGRSTTDSPLGSTGEFGAVLAPPRPTATATRVETGQGGPEAAIAPATALSQEGLDFIRRHEGFGRDPKHPGRGIMYNDVANNATVGYGHLVHRGPIGTNIALEAPYVNGITREEGSALLARDLEPRVAAVAANVEVDLTQPQFDALVSFTYNVGISAFSHSTLVARINAGAGPEEIRAAFMMWLQPRAIAGRRQDEADLYLTGDY